MVRVSILLPRPRKRPTIGTKTQLRVEVLEARTLMSVDLVWTANGTDANNSSCHCSPPDPAGASGPNQVIETVNTDYAVYDKTSGSLITRQSLRSLFTPLGTVLNLSDPVVMYDDINGQFVIGVLDWDPGVSRFDLAISNDDDPSDGFYMQRYDMTHDGVGSSDFADYPKAGYNAEAYVFSFNMFPTGGPFHVDTLSVDKNTLTGFVNVVPGSHLTMTPAVMHLSNPGDPMWFVETGDGLNMKVVKMTDILSSTPSYIVYTLSVPFYTSPPPIDQPGGGGIYTVGIRVLDAAYFGGLLVAAHTIGFDGRALARWYEFDTTTNSPTLVQSGTIDQGPGIHTYFPTIEINYEFDLGLTFIQSSSSQFMSMYITGQSVSDFGSGTMQTPVVTHSGNSTYSILRAGDYSGISVDPTDGYTFYAFNEYKGSANWNTGVAGFGVSSDSSGPAPAMMGMAASAERLSPAAPAPADAPFSSRTANLDAVVVERLFTAVPENQNLLAAHRIRDGQPNVEEVWEGLGL